MFTGANGNATNELNAPIGLALDSATGTLYVADSGNNRVLSFLANASSGTVVAGGNGQGTGNTQLSNPSGIYFNSPSNSLLIANYGANNIVNWVLGSSSWTLVAGSPTGAGGTTSTLLTAPRDVTMDPMGNVYVADTNNNRIQFFPTGQTNGTTIAGSPAGVAGSNATLLHSPLALTLDAQLNLFVSDSNNYRVQEFPCC